MEGQSDCVDCFWSNLRLGNNSLGDGYTPQLAGWGHIGKLCLDADEVLGDEFEAEGDCVEKEVTV